MTSKSKKATKITEEDLQFIRANIEHMSVTEIAEAIGLQPDEVKAALSTLGIINLKEEEWEDMQRKRYAYSLRKKPYWKEIIKQLSEEAGEIDYFIATWAKLMSQFRDDVLYSEEMQIKQWIILEVLMNRSMKERRRHQDEADRLQKIIDDEYQKQPQYRDIAQLANMESQLGFARSAITTYTTEHTKLLNEVKHISKSLKATRDERIKRIEDGKTSWQGFLRMLEDEEEKARLGREIELMKIAKNNAKERLAKTHQYEDGVLDRPILNTEIVQNPPD